MTHPNEWLAHFDYQLRFAPPMTVNHQMAHEDRATLAEVEQNRHWRFPNTPAVKDEYVPPVLCTSIVRVQNHMLHSFAGLVADMWTSLLTRNADKIDRGIYTMWGDEIPVPNQLTCLAWLMVCETWPMLAAVKPEDSALQSLFPLQSFVIPQSSSKLYASHYPPEFVASKTWASQVPLDDLLNKHMNRADRERMAMPAMQNASLRVHRPQNVDIITYRHHARPGSPYSSLWHDNEGWPKNPVADLDCGVAYKEKATSWYHMGNLVSIRELFMAGVLGMPGLPTHQNSLYTCPGGWIRQWSECGFGVKLKERIFHWSPDEDEVEIGQFKTTYVPILTPRIWLGWTHFGPRYTVDNGLPIREESASSIWAKEYMRFRPIALKMLFEPESINMDSIVAMHTSARGRSLSRAKRFKSKEVTVSKSALDQFKAKFNSKKESE